MTVPEQVINQVAGDGQSYLGQKRKEKKPNKDKSKGEIWMKVYQIILAFKTQEYA
jgi:hypothetical protein